MMKRDSRSKWGEWCRLYREWGFIRDLEKEKDEEDPHGVDG
jgi:hypothetical protein